MKTHSTFVKYRNSVGEPVLQSIEDLFRDGPMIDEESGEEMELVDRSLYDENGDEIETDSFESDEDTSLKGGLPPIPYDESNVEALWE